MDNMNSPVQVGTHSPTLSQPLIQMGMLIHPSEIDHRAKVIDVAITLSALQAEVSMVRAEISTFRMAMIIQVEQFSEFVRAQSGSIYKDVRHDLNILADRESQMVRQFSRTEERFNELISMTHAHIDYQNQVLLDLKDQIRRVPETYLWMRVWRILQRIWA